MSNTERLQHFEAGNVVGRKPSWLGKIFVLCSLALLSVVIFFLIFPSWIGGLWHLFNGKAALYEGWNIPVPEGFFAYERHGSLFIVRMEPRFQSHGAGFDMVVISKVLAVNDFAFEKDFRKFREVESASASMKGLIESSTRTIQGSDGIRYCVEFGRSSNGNSLKQVPEMQISCFIAGQTTVFDYSGRQMFSSDVYSILQNMSRLPGYVQ